MSEDPHRDEVERIRDVYERRRLEGIAEHDWRVRLFIRQGRERALLGELMGALQRPLGACRVLDVGCGTGQWLADLETWGVPQPSLAGIELDPADAKSARERLPAADVRVGNAAELPWEAGSFDLVIQATMLSSILDPAMRRDAAGEMARVLAPGGVIVSYDMGVRSPNPQVRRVGKRELKDLFGGFEVRTRRVTLAVPVTRRIVGVSWTAAAALERTRVLNTQLLAVMRRPNDK